MLVNKQGGNEGDRDLSVLQYRTLGGHVKVVNDDPSISLLSFSLTALENHVSLWRQEKLRRPNFVYNLSF